MLQLYFLDSFEQVRGNWTLLVSDREFEEETISIAYVLPPPDQKALGSWKVVACLYCNETSELVSYSIQNFTLVDPEPEDFTMMVLFLASIVAAVIVVELFTRRISRVFKDLRNTASKIGTGEVPLDVQNEIQEIRESDTVPRGVFLELVIEIERKIRLLAEKAGMKTWRYSAVSRTTRSLRAQGIIRKEIADLIVSFWHIRNSVMHGRTSITKANLEEAIDIGRVVLSELEVAYKEASGTRQTPNS